MISIIINTLIIKKTVLDLPEYSSNTLIITDT